MISTLEHTCSEQGAPGSALGQPNMLPFRLFLVLENDLDADDELLDSATMPSIEGSPSAFVQRLREQRYRRQFLQPDARLSIRVILFTVVAIAITARNDVRFTRDQWMLFALYGIRFVHFVFSLIASWVLSRNPKPRKHDQAYGLWMGATVALMVLLSGTRYAGAEIGGPLVSGVTLLIIHYFAVRGPIILRTITAVLISLVVAVLVWNPRADLSPTARVTSTAALFLLNTAGYVTARAFEEQRFLRFLAELEEKRARRELTQKMAELAEEKKRAETMVRARTAFLATMSHEFRTPMNAVLGFSELLLGMPLDAGARDYAQAIRESARGLLGLLNDVLDFAKIDADKLALSSTPFDLRTLLASIIAMMEPMIGSRPISIELQSSPDVPEFVIGDEARLRQALVNLVSNAVKFTDRGHVRLYVSAETKGQDQVLVHFRVEDSGSGMNDEILDRLFQPFVQGDQGSTRRHQGSGLGLAITKRIVEAMGGDILVTSEVGKGSVFSFAISLLPCEAVSSKTGQTQKAQRRITSILVVDDHPINRRLAIAMLERLGYTADIAEDGPTAITMAREKKYDIIFMDLHMPGMSGLDAAKAILNSSRSGPEPHIVAMTASVFGEDREACRQAGMQGFIAKPIDLGQLDAILTRVAKKSDVLVPVESTPTSIDVSVLEQLRALEAVSEPGFYAAILRAFLDDVPQRLERVHQALNHSDAKALEFEAHTLKSMARSMGAIEMGDLCARIENTAKHEFQEQAALHAWVRALDEEFQRIEPILARETVKPRSDK